MVGLLYLFYLFYSYFTYFYLVDDKNSFTCSYTLVNDATKAVVEKAHVLTLSFQLSSIYTINQVETAASS